MGLVSQASNLVDRVVTLERLVEKIRKLAGNTSSIISRGGLTLLEDSFIKMVSSVGVQVVYFGPDPEGRQILVFRRADGSVVFFTGFTVSGNQYWRLTDRFNREVVSDDTETGGLARPWLSVPVSPRFSMAAGSVWSYMNLPAASVAAETTLWSGRIPLALHPYLQVAGVWGQASGAPSATYRVRVAGTEIGQWTVASGAVADLRGPWSIAPYLDQANLAVDVTVIATGVGNVACDVQGITLRQTP